MKLDEEFIAARYFNFDLLPDTYWLLKYFRTDVQKMFLKYYMIFGSVDNFVDHTGHHCTKRFLLKLESKYRALIEARAEAASILDEQHVLKLASIEQGRWRTR